MSKTEILERITKLEKELIEAYNVHIRGQEYYIEKVRHNFLKDTWVNSSYRSSKGMIRFRSFESWRKKWEKTNDLKMTRPDLWKAHTQQEYTTHLTKMCWRKRGTLLAADLDLI